MSLEEIERTADFGERWGVKIVLEDHDSDPVVFHSLDYSSGPIVGTICWPTKTVYWPPYRQGYGSSNVNALLHEISHCVVNVAPDDVDEVDHGLLAFELFSSRFLHLRGWKSWMHSFRCDWRPHGNDYLYCLLPHEGRSDVLRRSFQGAVRAGLLTPDGKLTFQC